MPEESWTASADPLREMARQFLSTRLSPALAEWTGAETVADYLGDSVVEYFHEFIEDGMLEDEGIPDDLKFRRELPDDLLNLYHAVRKISEGDALLEVQEGMFLSVNDDGTLRYDVLDELASWYFLERDDSQLTNLRSSRPPTRDDLEAVTRKDEEGRFVQRLSEELQALAQSFHDRGLSASR